MAIDRRRFLTLAAAGLAAAALPAGAVAAAGALFASGVRRPDGSFAAVILDEGGREVAGYPIAARVHDAARDPVNRRAVLFARRPGRFALAVDLARPDRQPVIFAPPEDRHFYGHGVFSPDGRLLYTTENDFDGFRGVVGVYDAAAGFRRLGEFETHGVGPHEIILGPGGDTLLVANGGIETHPDFGRDMLNLDSMKPSLAVIDRASGVLRDVGVLPGDVARLSIRHLAVDGSEAVWFGGQWHGDALAPPPAMGRLDRNGRLTLADWTDHLVRAAAGYVGAVAASRDGATIAASCPTTGLVLILDAATGRLLSTTPLRDTSGLADAGEHGFLASSGDGGLVSIDGGASVALPRHDDRFDNHLRRL